MEEINRFVVLANSGRFTITDLCEQFGISRKTSYKHLERYAAHSGRILPGGLRETAVWHERAARRSGVTSGEPAIAERVEDTALPFAAGD